MRYRGVEVTINQLHGTIAVGSLRNHAATATATATGPASSSPRDR